LTLLSLLYNSVLPSNINDIALKFQLFCQAPGGVDRTLAKSLDSAFVLLKLNHYLLATYRPFLIGDNTQDDIRHSR